MYSRAQNAGNEAAADALDLMRRRLSAGQHGTVGGFDGHGFERWLLRFDVLADSGDGAAGAHAGDQDVGAAIGIVPDLRAGGFEVNLGIGRIVELLQHVAVGSIGQNLFGFDNGAGHAARTGRKNDLRAEREQKHAALQAHGFGHDDDQSCSP